MGGLSAGIHARRNHFDATIFESHMLPGGQCTGYTRNGYVLDCCMHHFGGGFPTSKIAAFWQELGVQPCEEAVGDELIRIDFTDGTSLHDYCDLDRLQEHLKLQSPEDGTRIDRYVNTIRRFAKTDVAGPLMLGSIFERLKVVPTFLSLGGQLALSLGGFAKRFQNPKLREAVALLHYATPQFPFFGHVFKKANIARGGIAWPRGGSLSIAKRMAARYIELNGAIAYRKKVAKILTEGDRAYGVELEDGSRHEADYVISNADGRKTIMQMLEGRYLNKKIARYCEPNSDVDLGFSVAVFLGVNKDLSEYPPAVIRFLKHPITLCGQTVRHLDLSFFGHDASVAPAGKGVIKVELVSKPSYLAQFANDRQAYKDETSSIAQKVVSVLETMIPGIGAAVEVVDVTTLLTWEHYMNGSQGWYNWPHKAFSFWGDVCGFDDRYELPGLRGFYMTGQWVTSIGGLLMNAISGKSAIEKICRDCNQRFA